MKEKFDFHAHTAASDGSYSPHSLVKKAMDEGLEFIAITDHDTIAGVGEAFEAGKEFGVMVIGGVEISIDFEPGTMHLCGYFFDIENQQLNDALRYVQEARFNRNPQIIEKLNEAGIDITMSEVEDAAGGKQIGRPHMAKVMLAKNYVKDIKEAFNKYLAKEARCYVDKKRLTLEKAVDIIKNAGGVAVLAHPGEMPFETKEEYETLLSYIKERGVFGLESYSSHHNEEENLMFKQLAERAGLFSTGGSDFHGETKPDIELGVFAESCDIEINALIEKMKQSTKLKEKK